MVVLIRNGVEVAADDAPDSFQAVKVAARLILAQDSLHVGDQLVIARV
jgi:hypothetical protein